MQQSRLDKAKLIIDRPADFKVCEACGSIVSETTAACPNCNAYRFDANPDYVVEQAVLLASREQRSVMFHRPCLADALFQLVRRYEFSLFIQLVCLLIGDHVRTERCLDDAEKAEMLEAGYHLLDAHLHKLSKD